MPPRRGRHCHLLIVELLSLCSARLDFLLHTKRLSGNPDYSATARPARASATTAESKGAAAS